MISAIRSYIYGVALGVLAFLGVYLYNKGRQDEADEQTQDDFYALRQAKKVRDDVQDDAYFVDRAKQWLKDD